MTDEALAGMSFAARKLALANKAFMDAIKSADEEGTEFRVKHQTVNHNAPAKPPVIMKNVMYR